MASYYFMTSLRKTVAKQLVSNENDSSTTGAAIFFPPFLSPTVCWLSIAAPGPIQSLNLNRVAYSFGGTHCHDNCLGYAISLLYNPGMCIRRGFILQRSGVKKAGLVYAIYHAILMPLQLFLFCRREYGAGPKSFNVVAPPPIYLGLGYIL